ncbi:sulfite exporter TauE/SafE family protein [Candidatus Micrarchaeota archaeon]|nr:sulfite exporter TauE/SafE family protein [Candidatus Micrarchaeota archaeon]
MPRHKPIKKSKYISYSLLELIFAVWVILSAGLLFFTADQEKSVQTVNINKRAGLVASAIGGTLVGLISTGMGNILVPWMNVYGGMPIKRTVATCMFVIFATALVSALTYAFLVPLDWNMLLYTIPGVLIGGQIGPRISEKLDPVLLKKGMSVTFFFLGLIMILKRHALW